MRCGALDFKVQSQANLVAASEEILGLHQRRDGALHARLVLVDVGQAHLSVVVQFGLCNMRMWLVEVGVCQKRTLIADEPSRVCCTPNDSLAAPSAQISWIPRCMDDPTWEKAPSVNSLKLLLVKKRKS